MTDPYYANVSLLLPMNGANNYTVFTDYSQTPKTITRYGGTKTVTAQSKYYGSSGYFDGDGDHLSVPDRNAYVDFTKPFTFETWVRLDANSTTERELFSSTFDSNFYGHYWDCFNGKSSFGFCTVQNPQTWAAQSVEISSGVTPGVWHHIAVSKTDTHLRMFLNGVTRSTLVLSQTITNTTYGTAAWIGGYSNVAAKSINGHLQDYRITAGIARYTADFTPPSRLLPGISGTILDTTGTPCARQIYVYNRSTGALLASTTSDSSTGHYEALAHPAAAEVFRVVVANEATLYNDLIDRAIPE